MLNIEKYKDTIINAAHADLSCCVRDEILHLNCIKSCRECKKEIVGWLTEEYSEPILDDAEKKYLSAVIKPFRRKVKIVRKRGDSVGEYLLYLLDRQSFSLPYFDKGTMYKGMDTQRDYTLEELGL